ncbi:hypothetical protein B7Z17_00085 [Candidatus Saccharibacteria bacterium 32-49-10]|nr:MAG: hypothetical protein B7Z17_00085 [Candidatus Saccharibacteria bacterium 32-49-10]
MVKKKTNIKTSLNSTLKSFAQTDEQSVVLARDVTTSILVVSLLINLAVLVGWLALQVTTQYDIQVAQFLFSR